MKTMKKHNICLSLQANLTKPQYYFVIIKPKQSYLCRLTTYKIITMNTTMEAKHQPQYALPHTTL